MQPAHQIKRAPFHRGAFFVDLHESCAREVLINSQSHQDSTGDGAANG